MTHFATDREVVAWVTNPDGSFRWPYSDRRPETIPKRREWAKKWIQLCNANGLARINCNTCYTSLIEAHEHLSKILNAETA